MTTCPTCGHSHERITSGGRTKPTCTGHKSDGTPCTNWPVKGATVCAQRHGGSAPQVRRSAMMRQEEARARTILERLGEPEPIGHPVQELLAVAAELKAWQQVVRERIAELTDYTITDKFATEREHGLVLLYERNLTRTGRLLIDMAKLTLEAKKLKLDQRAAQDIMAATVEALRRIGLGIHEPAFREALRDVLAEMNA